MAHSHSQVRYRAIDLFSASGRVKIGSGRSSNLHRLAVQLTLDPDVRSLGFVAALPLAGEKIEVGMLVAERAEGRVAYDIVDERPHRDIDAEGLLLIALERHGIAPTEVDSSTIGVEPHAGNCDRIWAHRSLEVGRNVRATIESALRARRLSIRDLGREVSIRNVMPTVCALIARRILYTELSTKFESHSWIARRVDRAEPPLEKNKSAAPTRTFGGVHR